MLYLDSAASMPVCKCAIDVLNKSQVCDYANSSSSCRLGKQIAKKIEEARKDFLNFLGARDLYKFIFTSSATESNNMILFGVVLNAGDRLFVSSADHPSVTRPVEILKKRGVQVSEILLDNNGHISDDFLDMLDEKVKLVVLTHVNNQSGTIQNIIVISSKIKKKYPSLYIHVDSAQGFGKIPLSLEDGMIDSLSISAHKMGGPKGIAGVYIKNSRFDEIVPLIYGGGHESGKRASTLAAPLIFSFVEAAGFQFERSSLSLRHVFDLYEYTRAKLEEKLCDIIYFPFDHNTVSPYILTFILPDISSDIIMRHLEQYDIFVSSGSACSSKIRGENKVLASLGIPVKFHKFVLRISFADNILRSDVDFFVNNLDRIYRELKCIIR